VTAAIIAAALCVVSALVVALDDGTPVTREIDQ